MCTENKREENNDRSLYCTSRTPELEMVIKEYQGHIQQYEFKTLSYTHTHTQRHKTKTKNPCPLSKQIHVVKLSYNNGIHSSMVSSFISDCYIESSPL